MNFRLFSLCVLMLSCALVHGQTTTTPGTTTDTTTTTTTTSNTGVIVYELTFKHLAGFNAEFYDGGFLVVPATGGGKGSVIFTSTDSGRRIYRAFENSVSYFPARSKEQRYNVITMTGTTSATVSMQAYGKADHKLTIDNSTFTMSVKVANKLRGIAQAALDESSKATTSDNTNGFVEYSEMKVNIDEGETNKANDKSLSVSTTFTNIKNTLTARGYSDGAPPATTTPPTTTQGGPFGTTPVGGGVTNP